MDDLKQNALNINIVNFIEEMSKRVFLFMEIDNLSAMQPIT
jgi:hypothetical protein